MNYFQYIFTDKKAFPYWVLYYVVILFYLVFSIVTEPSIIKNPIFLILFIILFAVFLLFYSHSYTNYRKREKFLKKYENRIKTDSLVKRKVEISQESYNTTAPKTNFSVKISPKIKKDEFLTALIDNYIVIMGKSYAFGVFRKDLKPIIVSLGGEPIKEIFEYAKSPKNYIIKFEENNLEIVFLSSIYNMNKIKLKNITNCH